MHLITSIVAALALVISIHAAAIPKDGLAEASMIGRADEVKRVAFNPLQVLTHPVKLPGIPEKKLQQIKRAPFNPLEVISHPVNAPKSKTTDVKRAPFNPLAVLSHPIKVPSTKSSSAKRVAFDPLMLLSTPVYKPASKEATHISARSENNTPVPDCNYVCIAHYGCLCTNNDTDSSLQSNIGVISKAIEGYVSDKARLSQASIQPSTQTHGAQACQYICVANFGCSCIKDLNANVQGTIEDVRKAINPS